MKQYTAILIGAGLRGKTYTDKMFDFKDKFKVIGVAEPIQGRRDYIKNKHNISDEMCFHTYEEILSKPKMADIAIICTMDDLHYEPAMKAIELGYNILLEKPVAPTEQECVDIALAAERKGVKVLVCHVLRYTPFFKKIKQLVMEGIEFAAVGIVARGDGFAANHFCQSLAVVFGAGRGVQVDGGGFCGGRLDSQCAYDADDRKQKDDSEYCK